MVDMLTGFLSSVLEPSSSSSSAAQAVDDSSDPAEESMSALPRPPLLEGDGHVTPLGGRNVTVALLEEEGVAALRDGSSQLTQCIHLTANEPSIGLHRVFHHVRRTVPELVERRRELAKQAQRVEGIRFDIDFASQVTQALAGITTFALIHQQLLYAIRLKAKIDERSRTSRTSFYSVPSMDDFAFQTEDAGRIRSLSGSGSRSQQAATPSPVPSEAAQLTITTTATTTTTGAAGTEASAATEGNPESADASSSSSDAAVTSPTAKRRSQPPYQPQQQQQQQHQYAQQSSRKQGPTSGTSNTSSGGGARKSPKKKDLEFKSFN